MNDAFKNTGQIPALLLDVWLGVIPVNDAGFLPQLVTLGLPGLGVTFSMSGQDQLRRSTESRRDDRAVRRASLIRFIHVQHFTQVHYFKLRHSFF